MTKQEFLIQATLNGFIGFSRQTDRIGGEYIVASAVAAWERLEHNRELDETLERVTQAEFGAGERC